MIKNEIDDIRRLSTKIGNIKTGSKNINIISINKIPNIIPEVNPIITL